jgi:hypothetical protein
MGEEGGECIGGHGPRINCNQRLSQYIF